jgi:hypothetical protein
MQKTKITLQRTEGLIFKAAAQIYSAYLGGGKIAEGDEQKWMERSLREAVQLAQLTDTRVQSDQELD